MRVTLYTKGHILVTLYLFRMMFSSQIFPEKARTWNTKFLFYQNNPFISFFFLFLFICVNLSQMNLITLFPTSFDNNFLMKMMWIFLWKCSSLGNKLFISLYFPVKVHCVCSEITIIRRQTVIHNIQGNYCLGLQNEFYAQ